MDKTEWPTEKRLEELRADGKVASSRQVIVCLVALVVFSSPMFMQSAWREFLSQYKVVFAGEFEGGVFKGVQALLDLALPLLLVPIIALLCIGLAAGLAQTKGLFLLRTLAIDVGRLSPFREVRFSRFVWGWPVAAIAAAVQIFITAIVLYLITPGSLGLFNKSHEVVLTWLSATYVKLMPVFLVLFVFLAAIGVFYERRRFRYANRMSRKEIEEESRAG
jgi:flagellar biosynthesis protein FlhB